MSIEDIIRQFIEAQDYVIEELHRHYGIDRIIRAVDWAFMASDLRKKHRASPFAKIFRVHGYGLEFKDEHVHIDYDYSHSGRKNGFDGWRLFFYANQNNLECPCKTHFDFSSALERKVLRGELNKEAGVFFLPTDK